MNLHRAAVFVLTTLLAAVPARAQEWFPFETIEHSALPIVRASVNGIGGHRLVLDVGFNDLLLDTMLVDGAGMELVNRGEIQEIDFYGKKETVPVSYVQSLEFGEATFQLVRTLLIEGEDGTGMGGLRSYGRIGRDILEPLRVTVHYPRELLYMEASPDDEVPPGGVEFSSVGRFLLVPVSMPSAEGMVEGDFVIDPGTSLSLMDRKWADKNKVAPKKAPDVRIEGVTIGGFAPEEVSLVLGDMHALPYDGQPVGVIGADVLRSLSVTYDFARDLIWLTLVPKDES